MKKNLISGKSINDVRRPVHRPTKEMKPKKGAGYTRKKKHKKSHEDA